VDARATRRPSPAAGFTLVETLIAIVLSSLVVLLVASTFLVQNNYYAVQTQRTRAHDNARVATELIASEIRSTMQDGIVVAGPTTLTVRSPIVLGVVCDRPALDDADVHTEGGQIALDTAEVAGVALRDAVTGGWTYATATWATVDRNDASSPSNCFANGADTTGASAEFHRLGGLDALFSPTPVEGDVLMLYRETTFKLQPSTLDPGALGLFRAAAGDSLVEFATGMDTTAQFQYRTGGASYADTIADGSLGDIDVVRIVADARKPPGTGGGQDITFGWAVNIAIRNVR
jgi:type II secretory pathway pseudopilin PulG